MQTEGERAASRAVENALAESRRTNAWLVDATKADKGTIGTFLAGETWPRRTTLAKIEGALGWPVGTIMDIAEGRAEPPDIEDRQAPTEAEIVDAERRQSGAYYLSNEELLAELTYRIRDLERRNSIMHGRVPPATTEPDYIGRPFEIRERTAALRRRNPTPATDDHP